jgi:RNA-binding protein 39
VSRGFGFVTFGSSSEARRAIAELNGLEVLGRPIKVGECKGSDGLARADGKPEGDELEEDDVMVLNQATRSMLMAKLQREDNAPASVSDAVQEAGLVLVPSRCLVLQNCFDAALEDSRPDNANWESEIQGDVAAECETHGKVEHCKLEKQSGCIYVKFADISGAVAAREALNGRFFGGQTVAVNFVSSQVYHKKYGV